MTSANIPATKIIIKVQSEAKTHNAKQADTDRRAVNTIIQKDKPAQPNIMEEQQCTLETLKTGKSITVLLADWGPSKHNPEC